MPKNRFAEVRYRALDKCLRDSKRYYTIDDLAAKCSEAVFKVDEKDRSSISIRQIQFDLQYMKSEAGYQAEIVSQKIPGSKKNFYRYADPSFSISKRPLGEKDAENLRMSISILQRFKGLPESEWIDEFAARIQTLQELDPQTGEIISFEHEEYFKGSEWISSLYLAINAKQPLIIQYKPYLEEEQVHLVSPYLLKQFNRRWFLFCRTNMNQYLTNLPLDRIERIEPGHHSFEPYPGEKPSDFFEDIIGVTSRMEEPVQVITLEVEKTLLPYLISKPLHGSQKGPKPTNDEAWYRLEIRIKTNYEFYATILSHGDRIRIIEPLSAKLKIKSIIEKMLKNY